MREPNPRPKINTAFLGLKLPPELLEQAQAAAQRDSRTLPDLVREFLRKYTRRAGKVARDG